MATVPQRYGGSGAQSDIVTGDAAGVAVFSEFANMLR